MKLEELYAKHLDEMEQLCKKSIRFRIRYRWMMFWDCTVTDWKYRIGWYKLLNKIGWYDFLIKIGLMEE